MRTRYLVILQLTAMMVFSSASFEQSKSTFSAPQSLLLFSGDFGNLLLAAPGGNLVVPHPPGSIVEISSPLPALGPAGDQVAASFRLPDDPGSAICHPSWPARGPYKRPMYKSVLGVHSLRDKTWKLYGDFCFVGSEAFSPDGKKVAFKATIRSDDPRFESLRTPDTLMILDLKTGQLTPVPDTAGVMGNKQLSWSPDGKYLAVSLSPSADHSPGLIGLIEIGSWVQKVIAEGTDPSWSPKGDWIAYDADWNQTCTLIHPDGTDVKVVLDLRHRSGGWIFYRGTVWSPNGEKLLLNEEQMDGGGYDVTMLDLTTSKATRKSKKGQVVFGWVSQSRD